MYKDMEHAIQNQQALILNLIRELKDQQDFIFHVLNILSIQLIINTTLLFDKT